MVKSLRMLKFLEKKPLYLLGTSYLSIVGMMNMLRLCAIKLVTITGIFTYILSSGLNWSGIESAYGQSWGGLYNMDRMLSEGHPFIAPRPLKSVTPKIPKGSSYITENVPNAKPASKKGTFKRDEKSKTKDLFSEIRFGAFLHDTGPFSASDEEGVDVNLEMLFGPPKSLAFIWSPRPHLGISYNSSGDTSHAYTGLTWDWSFWDYYFVELGFGGMVHDGHLVGVDGESKSLGCRVLFRESFNAGYRFTKHHSLMLHFDHSSNASLCKKNTSDGTTSGRHNVVLNEGLENVGIRYGYSF